MQCSASLPTSSPSTRVRPLSSSTTWNSCGPSPAVTPVQSEVYGFIRSPVAERGRSWRNTSRSAEAREKLLDAENGDEHRWQRGAHAPVPFGLDDADGAGLGDAEVRAADTDARSQEPLAQVDACCLRQLGRVVGADPRRDRPCEEVADLGAVAVDRRHEDVRRPVAVELEDQLGEVGLDRVDALLARAPR